MNTDRIIKFCCYCGSALAMRVLDGDDCSSSWCEQCQQAHYRNPTILVAAFLHCGKKLLWTRRGIDPGKGKWAFPAGFVECNESLQHAAARELREETKISVSPEHLMPMSMSSVLPIDQIYVVFRYPCERELAASITPETSQWAWLDRQSAPWDEMAHPHSRGLVEQVYTAVETGDFFMRVGHMSAEGSYHRSYPLGDIIPRA
jgi:ADP-ribose pyrophosphatase YjhB (NUDIX family)